jgi:hypothetical protein
VCYESIILDTRGKRRREGKIMWQRSWAQLQQRPEERTKIQILNDGARAEEEISMKVMWKRDRGRCSRKKESWPS